MKQPYKWAKKMTPVELSTLIDHTVINAGKSIIRMRRAVKENDLKSVCEESDYLTGVAEKFDMAMLGEKAKEIGTACLSENTEEVTDMVRGLVVASNRELMGLFENKAQDTAVSIN